MADARAEPARAVSRGGQAASCGGPPRPRRRGAGRLASAFLAGAALFAAACSLDYDLDAPPSSDELPDLVFRDFTHTVVDRGARVFSVRADLAETYEKARRTELEGVAFTEYDRSNGLPATSGSAERAVIYLDTEDAEFFGSIRIDSTREDMELEAEYLSWDAQEKRLEGRLDRIVSISRGDGSSIRGAGFSVDARRRSLSFREAVEGRLVAEDEPPAAP